MWEVVVRIRRSEGSGSEQPEQMRFQTYLMPETSILRISNLGNRDSVAGMCSCGQHISVSALTDTEFSITEYGQTLSGLHHLLKESVDFEGLVWDTSLRF